MFEPVFLEWYDSAGMYGWVNLSEAQGLASYRCSTLGFVIEETDDVLTISQSYSAAEPDYEQRVFGVFTIPKVAILKRFAVRPTSLPQSEVERIIEEVEGQSRG